MDQREFHIAAICVRHHFPGEISRGDRAALCFQFRVESRTGHERIPRVIAHLPIFIPILSAPRAHDDGCAVTRYRNRSRGEVFRFLLF